MIAKGFYYFPLVYFFVVACQTNDQKQSINKEPNEETSIEEESTNQEEKLKKGSATR